MEKPCVYICYRSPDTRDIASVITEAFQRAGMDPFIDYNITPGKSMATEIEKHLAKAHAIVILLSPNFFESEYCVWELHQAQLHRREKGIIVLPVYLDINSREYSVLMDDGEKLWRENVVKKLMSSISEEASWNEEAFARSKEDWKRSLREVKHLRGIERTNEPYADLVKVIVRAVAKGIGYSLPNAEQAHILTPQQDLPPPKEPIQDEDLPPPKEPIQDEPLNVLTPPQVPDAPPTVAKARSNATTSLLSDGPASIDKLNVDAMARAISIFLLDSQTEPPLTIGLHAPWGHGKSSFMLLLEHHLLRAAMYREVNKAGKLLFENSTTSLSGSRERKTSAWFPWRAAHTTSHSARELENHILKDDEKDQAPQQEELPREDKGMTKLWSGFPAWRILDGSQGTEKKSRGDYHNSGKDEHSVGMGGVALAPHDRFPWWSAWKAESDLRNSNSYEVLQKRGEACFQRHKDVVERMGRSHVVTVAFNPWHHHGQQEVWAGLAATIGKKLEQSMGWRSHWRAILEYSWQKHRSELLMSFFLPLAVAAVLFSVVAVVFPAIAEKLGGDTVEWSKRVYPISSVLFVVLALWRLVKVLKPISENMCSYISDPTSAHVQRLGYQNRVIQDLQFLHGRLPGGPKVVVFVDDLDRCEDRKVVEVLQAVNLVLSNCQFFTVIGVDLKMVKRAVYLYYNQGAVDLNVRSSSELTEERFSHEEASEFLKKIIQIPFELPIMDETARSFFVGELFGAADEAADKELETWLKAQPAPSRQSKEDGQTQGGDLAGDGIDDPAGVRITDDLLSGKKPDRKDSKVQEDSQARTGKVDLNHVSKYLFGEGDQLECKLERKAFLHFEAFLPRNPRTLKQMVNHYRLVALLSREGPHREGEVEEKDKNRLEVFKLAKWVVFVYIFPEKARVLTKELRESTNVADVWALCDSGAPEPSPSNADKVSDTKRHIPQVAATRQVNEELWLKFKETFPEMIYEDVQAFRRYLNTV